jgi:hypothetical protein
MFEVTAFRRTSASAHFSCSGHLDLSTHQKLLPHLQLRSSSIGGENSAFNCWSGIRSIAQDFLIEKVSLVNFQLHFETNGGFPFSIVKCQNKIIISSKYQYQDFVNFM